LVLRRDEKGIKNDTGLILAKVKRITIGGENK
jgi:hypothetical protein